MIFMGIYNKVYIGHVETINPDVIENVSPVESKVVALKLASIDKVTSIPTYKPLRPYSEYYKLVSVDSKPLEGPLGNIVDDKIIRWKVENSWGDKDNKGYFIMNDNYFDEFVMNAVVKKEYLTSKQLEMLNQEAINMNPNDPF